MLFRSRAQAAVQVLFIDIGQHLLPVLTKIVGAVAPAVNWLLNFASAVSKSSIMTTSLNLLGGGIKNVINFISMLVGWGVKVVGFFQKNQVAALALLIPLGMLGAILTAMAVGAIASFIATIPAMIAGFVAWTAGAAAAAIATLAATWPLLLIGAAVGLVIAIIILLWTHWSQVTKWMGAAMSWLGNFFHMQAMVIGQIGRASCWGRV